MTSGRGVLLAVVLGVSAAAAGCGDKAGKEAEIRGPVGADRDIPTEGVGNGKKAKPAPKPADKPVDK
jgi:hypothetical protein